MKRISEYIISILVIGVIIYAFQVKADRDQLILTGKEILLELAPVDPLSLLQGQYMIINFALEREEIEMKEEDVNSGRIDLSPNGSVRIVLRYNGSGVASFNRFKDDQLLASNEILFKIKARRRRENGSEYFYRIDVEQESFLFKENTEKKYETAKYGVFKVNQDGDYVLVDLADKDLNRLTVIETEG
ncbi:MAG: hypothetical protein CMO46_00625 [Verrucomicrobiales bacterium]|nr:hypothetical protein [Verrucomicrobiales bacterium]